MRTINILSAAVSHRNIARNFLVYFATCGAFAIASVLGAPEAIPGEQEEQAKHLDTARIRVHLNEASEKDLAKVLVRLGDMKVEEQKRQHYIEAQKGIQQHCLSRIDQVTDDWAAAEKGENSSVILSKMLHTLEVQGIEPALAYLDKHIERLLELAEVRVKADDSEDVADSIVVYRLPILVGAQLAVLTGKSQEGHLLFQKALSISLPNWPKARYEYLDYLLYIDAPFGLTPATIAYQKKPYDWIEIQANVLSNDDPEKVKWLDAIGESYAKLGAMAVSQGHLNAALSLWSNASRVFGDLMERDSENNEWQSDFAACNSWLGAIAIEQGDLAAARDHYDTSLKIIDSLATSDPENTEKQRDLAFRHNDLGTLALKEGDEGRAREHWLKCMEIFAKMIAEKKTLPDEDQKFVADLKLLLDSKSK